MVDSKADSKEVLREAQAYWVAGAPDKTRAVELAAEAIMRSVDRLTDSQNVLGAAEEEFGVVVERGNLAHAEGSDLYEDYLRIRFPVIERDEVS